MSSIPSAKMKHAHAHEGDHPEQSQHASNAATAQASGGQNAERQTHGVGTVKPKADKGTGAKLTDRAKDLGERAQDLAEDAVDAVKSHPKTAAAIGAAIVAGAAALVGGPAAARALKGDGKKPAAKKTAAKKSAAKKS